VPLNALAYTGSIIQERRSARRVLEVLSGSGGSGPAGGQRPAVVSGTPAGGGRELRVRAGGAARCCAGVSWRCRRARAGPGGRQRRGQEHAGVAGAAFLRPGRAGDARRGKDLPELKLAGLRSRVAVVLQSRFLFPDRWRRTSPIRPPARNNGRVEAAARAANAHGLSPPAPGYDTVLGERGAACREASGSDLDRAQRC